MHKFMCMFLIVYMCTCALILCSCICVCVRDRVDELVQETNMLSIKKTDQTQILYGTKVFYLYVFERKDV